MAFNMIIITGDNKSKLMKKKITFITMTSLAIDAAFTIESQFNQKQHRLF